jgi:hypothetical protein
VLADERLAKKLHELRCCSKLRTESFSKDRREITLRNGVVCKLEQHERAWLVSAESGKARWWVSHSHLSRLEAERILADILDLCATHGHEAIRLLADTTEQVYASPPS